MHSSSYKGDWEMCFLAGQQNAQLKARVLLLLKWKVIMSIWRNLGKKEIFIFPGFVYRSLDKVINSTNGGVTESKWSFTF